jgi:hypothetical protein
MDKNKERITKELTEQANAVVSWMETWINNTTMTERIARLEAIKAITDKSLQLIEEHMGIPIPHESYQRVYKDNIDYLIVTGQWKNNKKETS